MAEFRHGTPPERDDEHRHDHRRPQSSAHGHEHGPHHEHAPGRSAVWARVRHALTPHSHDSADRVDRALESSRAGLRTLLWSFLALLATAVAQGVVVAATGSVALLGDTVHNVADALTSIPVALAFLVGRRRATRRYTYGLGRAEDLAGLVVVLVIAGSAVFVGWESVHRLVEPQAVSHLWAVAAAGVIGFAGNELVARWRIRVGRRIGSAALVADGLHARTDGIASLAVVVGALGVAVGIPFADPLVGLAMTAVILLVLRDAATEVFRRLMDGVDPALVDLVEHTAGTVAGVHGVEEVRLRWTGHSLRAELAITVEAQCTVREAHLLAHRVEHALCHAVPRLGAAVVHTQPTVGADGAHDLLADHR